MTTKRTKESRNSAAAHKSDPAVQARQVLIEAWLNHQAKDFRTKLTDWFDLSARALPWRGQRDPYRIMLSELMLQQTQVNTVIPYYQAFLDRWPTLTALAAAHEQDVLKAWEGLGYYSRARHLHAAAQQVVKDHAGRLPQDEKSLRQLAGIGEYTAGAILSIAFGIPTAAVDGNVVRVFSRLAAVSWLPDNPRQRQEVRQCVESLIPQDRPGDFNEALMDLGATICTPRQPLCDKCPVQSCCLAYANGTTENYPARTIRKVIPLESRTCLILAVGKWVHVCRKTEGLLAGLYEFDWLEDHFSEKALRQILQERYAGKVRHVQYLGRKKHIFSHRQWLIDAWSIELDPDLATPAAHSVFIENSDSRPVPSQLLPGSGQWIRADQLSDLPFSTALAGWRNQLVDRA